MQPLVDEGRTSIEVLVKAINGETVETLSLIHICMLIVVPKWCPTLQNYVVTGYAALFVGFEL